MLLPWGPETLALLLPGVSTRMFKVCLSANETFLKIEKNTQIDGGTDTGISLISKVKQNLILLFYLEIFLNRKGEKF